MARPIVRDNFKVFIMRRVISSIAVLLLLALAVWYLVGRLTRTDDKTNQDETLPPPAPPPLTYATKPEVGFLAPDFLLKTIDGREVRLSDYLNKYVVVNFWNTRCPFCLTELRNYSRLVTETRGELAVVSVNRGEASVVVDNFLKNYIYPSNIVFVLNDKYTIYSRYNGSTMPESFFIDSSGVIRDHVLGELTYDDMRTRVLQLFGRPLPPAAVNQ